MAVWPVARAGTAPPSGWMLGPELPLTRGLLDCLADTGLHIGHSALRRSQLACRTLRICVRTRGVSPRACSVGSARTSGA
eukprot:7014525-Alexandrium_andersonii.AAC.1